MGLASTSPFRNDKGPDKDENGEEDHDNDAEEEEMEEEDGEEEDEEFCTTYGMTLTINTPGAGRMTGREAQQE